LFNPEATPLLALRNAGGLPADRDGAGGCTIFLADDGGDDPAIAATYIMGQPLYRDPGQPIPSGYHRAYRSEQYVTEPTPKNQLRIA
jgi:hypothetical protein